VKILLVGSGGREHALAWKLAQSSLLAELHAAPGSPGIAALGQCHPVRAEDSEGLVELSRSLGADLVVVGPEAPLVAGLADELRRNGVAVFGPSAAAAAIEGSKVFAKDVMRSAGVPTAATLPIARPPCVVKADGLAAGKGVAVCRTQEELDAGLAAVSAFGDRLVIEELLEGPEISLLAVCDGSAAIPLALARDYKRAYDGDVGPNTGGMGSYAPVGGYDDAAVGELQRLAVEPVLAELEQRGTPFVGCLFAGLIVTEDGPRVLEYNCRFGDPETQSIVPLVDGDLLEMCAAAAAGELAGVSVGSRGAAVTLVLAAGGYPASGATGVPIAGVEAAEVAGALVFHAGTGMRAGRLVATGGRVLNVVGRGETVDAARRAAYAGAAEISFEGMRYRADIAAEPTG